MGEFRGLEQAASALRVISGLGDVGVSPHLILSQTIATANAVAILRSVEVGKVPHALTAR